MSSNAARYLCLLALALAVHLGWAVSAGATLIHFGPGSDITEFASAEDFGQDDGGILLGNRPSTTGQNVTLFGNSLSGTLFELSHNSEVGGILRSFPNATDFANSANATEIAVLPGVDSAEVSMAMNDAGEVFQLASDGSVWMWSSVGDFVTDTNRQLVGTRTDGNGVTENLAIDDQGRVISVDEGPSGSPPGVGDVFLFASIQDFANDALPIANLGPGPGGFHGGNSAIAFVPEPGTMVLLGSGLIGLALSGRRRA